MLYTRSKHSIICRSIILQKQTNKQKKLMGKEIRFVVTRSAEWDQLNENSQKVQTSNYKISKC